MQNIDVQISEKYQTLLYCQVVEINQVSCIQRELAVKLLICMTSELNRRDDLTTIFKCAKILSHVLINTLKEQTWSFTGSLVRCNGSVIPIKLKVLERWILQGSKAHSHEIDL